MDQSSQAHVTFKNAAALLLQVDHETGSQKVQLSVLPQ
jgi:hypothetical protein